MLRRAVASRPRIIAFQVTDRGGVVILWLYFRVILDLRRQLTGPCYFLSPVVNRVKTKVSSAIRGVDCGTGGLADHSAAVARTDSDSELNRSRIRANSGRIGEVVSVNAGRN